jgi:hypothetical protein
MSSDAPHSGSPFVNSNYWRAWCGHCWEYVLHCALAVWVVRVPVVVTLLGMLILDATPQAHDLFVEFSGTIYSPRPFLFLVLLFFVWAMPTYYTARELLESDERLQRCADWKHSSSQKRFLDLMVRYLPRGLGILTFVAMLIAIWRSHLNLPLFDAHPDQADVLDSINRSLAALAGLLLLAAAGFIFFIIEYPRIADLMVLSRTQRLVQRFWVWRSLSPGDKPRERAPNRERRVLLFISSMLLTIVALFPDWAAEQFPRGLAVPLILGAWLPLLSYLAGLGRRLRVPIIAGLGILVVVLNSIFGDNHSIRLINASETVGHKVDTAAMPLEEALALWMQENNCIDRPANCPRPLIVAASGGASRAAFFMASIIGYFMQEASMNGLDPNAVRRRLFAISGVSGGSVGAVMVTAALSARSDSNDHPCVQARSELWWGQTINNWRDCLEALNSGDFLTPVLVGLTFHDIFAFISGRDRAALLEDSWNRRYLELIRPNREMPTSKCLGLDCPFLTLVPRSGHWIPLLILNSTSERTGRRVVTTALAPTFAAIAHSRCPHRTPYNSCILFSEGDQMEADHFYTLRNISSPQSARRYPPSASVDDVRITTAAHNSARFPIISPPGSVRNKENEIVDRIVDGGYTDNYGVISAMNIATAIRAVLPELSPFVIVITNDPNDIIWELDVEGAPAQARRVAQRQYMEQLKLIEFNTNPLLPDVMSPIATIANNRLQEGVGAYQRLRRALSEIMPECEVQTVHIRVWRQIQGSNTLSMSWWLSTAVQRFLHQETEGTKQENENGPRLQTVWRAMKQTSACTTDQ